jgi:hypothetical protein
MTIGLDSALDADRWHMRTDAAQRRFGLTLA